jgi:hypothetical protein
LRIAYESATAKKSLKPAASLSALAEVFTAASTTSMMSSAIALAVVLPAPVYSMRQLRIEPAPFWSSVPRSDGVVQTVRGDLPERGLGAISDDLLACGVSGERVSDTHDLATERVDAAFSCLAPENLARRMLRSQERG